MTSADIANKGGEGREIASAPEVQRILVVEDNATARAQMRQLLESQGGLSVDVVGDGESALDALAAKTYSVVITDLRLPGLGGIDLLRTIQDRCLDVAVIVTTGHGSLSNAIDALRLGAADFLTKPIDVDHLQLILQRILRERRLRDEVSALREQLASRYSFQNVISKSPRMLAVFELINNIADTNSTVLIEGETGTGKEQVARAIHEASMRREGPMVAVNCAALPETLLESELFGHEKGAFTGATNRRVGRFEAANGGTIFLDEVGDIPPAMQAKLLRVLQERRIERVGSLESIDVDVRVIAATNKSLAQMVKNDEFREDLFYRLNVIRIELPPLRERMEDIPLLVAHFTRKYCRRSESPKEVDPDAMEALLNYSFPGNIRELENAIEFACVTTRGPTITRNNLPASVTAPVSDSPSVQVDLSKPLTQLLAELTETTERAYLQQALAKAHGNVGKCASICGLSRRSISAKLSLYGIDKVRFK